MIEDIPDDDDGADPEDLAEQEEAGERAYEMTFDPPDDDAEYATSSLCGGFLHALDQRRVGLLALLANVGDLGTARVAVLPEAAPVGLFLRRRVQAR